MLTVIENTSNVWLVITVDDELRVYARGEQGEWGELSLSEDSEQVDPEKSFMLEELYGRQSDQDEEGEPEAEEDDVDDEGEPDEGGPDLAEDEEPEDTEEEPEEEPKPRRRRAAAAKS